MNMLKSLIVVATVAFTFGSANALNTHPVTSDPVPSACAEVVNLGGDLRIIYVRVKTVTSAPIPNATVQLTKLTIPNESYTFTTNAFGEVAGEVLAKGPYVITVVAAGYTSQTITIAGTSEVRESFTLTPTH